MANVIADYLETKFEEVQPVEFYREIFREGILDDRGHFSRGKYVGVAVELGYDEDGKVNSRHKHIVTDDLDTIDELSWTSKKFCIISPISYAGWSRKTEHARTMFALGVEIDNLLVEERPDGSTYFKGLETLFHQWHTMDPYAGRTILPKPTFIAASGNGVHLYYQFDVPLRLTEWVKKSLIVYKEKLTRMLWNPYITKDSTEEKIQYESAFQAFRMVGTATRLGMTTGDREDRCRAFRVGEPVTIDYLNSFLTEEEVKKGFKISPTYEGKVTLAEAKKRWPEWHQAVVVEGKRYSKKWDIAGKVHGDDPFALYHWWLEKIRSGAVYGKRYHCMYCLAVYAIKNDVPEETLVADCYGLLEWFDRLSPSEGGDEARFTEADVEAALQVFHDEGYFNYPLRKITKRSGIHVEPNKRNYQKQADHLEEARAIRDIRMKRQGRKWDDNNGRPKGSGTAEQKVAAYRAEHPEASVTEVARALNVSRPTVYKWWDAVLAENKDKPADLFVPYQFTPYGVEQVYQDEGEGVNRSLKTPKSLETLQKHMGKKL